MKRLYLAFSLLFACSSLSARYGKIVLKRNPETGNIESYQKSSTGKHRWNIGVREDYSCNKYAAFELKDKNVLRVPVTTIKALLPGEKIKVTFTYPREKANARKILKDYARRAKDDYNKKSL